MQYDVMSNPLRKTQNVAGSTLAQSTDFHYLYTNQQPNAVKQIGNTSYSYDLNGNPTLVEGDSVYREMIWNEENRLMLLSDDGEVTRYTYDYAGNCAIKSHGPMTSVYINGALQGVDYHDDSDYTLYVSPFMTFNADRFTKYYYAGTQRIAGKIGSGKFENIYGEDGFHLTAGQKDYAQRAVNMLEGLQTYYQQTGVTPGVPNQLGKTADPYVSGTAYPSVALGNYDVPDGWPGKVVKHGKGEVPGPPVWFEEEDAQEAVAGVSYHSDNQRESDIFFYHTDHLQSTTYLTDSVGNISQFVWYAPYGEALIDEHVGSYENPYKFSGKELDENTGLYDHGARHRDPGSGVWYGVDALFEKYPSCSPYAYCGGNPVKFMDPNGMNWVKREVDGVTEIYYDRNVKSQNDLKGQKYNPTMLHDGDSFDGYSFYNDAKENKNGRVYKDGVLCSGKTPIRGGIEGSPYTLFVGVADDCVDAKTLHNNLFGTSYTGANNPKSYENKHWNYDYIPYNADEFGSIAHDQAYDYEDVSGAFAALTSTKVIYADIDLIKYNIKCADNALMYSADFKMAAKSIATATAFSAIVAFKYLILTFTP